MIAVFDLDGTVLDSSHRALINEKGGINIKEWRSHTAEQILNDSELPLADYMRFCIPPIKGRAQNPLEIVPISREDGLLGSTG